MAPEVFRDPSLPRTVKYDVYSFGILLWELLSGEKPFEAGKVPAFANIIHWNIISALFSHIKLYIWY